MQPAKILITGGVRSGKSHYAERLFAAEPKVTYLAPGPVPDPVTDPEWATRIAAHRARRPAGWTTVETHRVAEALQESQRPVLLDDLGTWVSAVVDALGTWEVPLVDWQPAFDSELQTLVGAWQAFGDTAVAVTNEVGWGLVSQYRSGRVFTDLLGRTNQAIAAASDRVVLLVAGRALEL